MTKRVLFTYPNSHRMSSVKVQTMRYWSNDQTARKAFDKHTIIPLLKRNAGIYTPDKECGFAGSQRTTSHTLTGKAQLQYSPICEIKIHLAITHFGERVATRLGVIINVDEVREEDDGAGLLLPFPGELYRYALTPFLNRIFKSISI